MAPPIPDYEIDGSVVFLAEDEVNVVPDISID